MHVALAGRLVRLTFCLALAFMLVGCDRDTSHLLPDCDVGALVAPTNLYPNENYIVSSLTPRLSWVYPEYCNPPGFLVSIYSPSSEAEVESHIFSMDGTRRSMETLTLQPGRMYSWQVRTSVAYLNSEWAIFLTGPMCTEGDRLEYRPVSLLTPPDGDRIHTMMPMLASDGSVIGELPRVHFTWDDAMPCLPPEGYTIEVSRDPNFLREEMLAMMTFTEQRTEAWSSYGCSPWEECATYYWRVHIGPVNMSASDPYELVLTTSEVRSFTVNTGDVICIPDLLSPSIPDLPIGLPVDALVEGSAKCRSGPGLDYTVLDYLDAGASVSISGRNADSSWWYILDPVLQTYCWISAEVVTVDGDVSNLPVIEVEPPALPEIKATETPQIIIPVTPESITATPQIIVTATPESTPAFNCAQYNTNPTACETSAGNFCRWDASVPPNGACVNR